MVRETPGDVPVSKRAPLWFGIFGVALGAAFVIAACYATTGGDDPTAYPMPDDGHQPIDINAMGRDR